MKLSSLSTLTRNDANAFGRQLTIMLEQTGFKGIQLSFKQIPWYFACMIDEVPPADPEDEQAHGDHRPIDVETGERNGVFYLWVQTTQGCFGVLCYPIAFIDLSSTGLNTDALGVNEAMPIEVASPFAPIEMWVLKGLCKALETTTSKLSIPSKVSPSEEI